VVQSFIALDGRQFFEATADPNRQLGRKKRQLSSSGAVAGSFGARAQPARTACELISVPIGPAIHPSLDYGDRSSAFLSGHRLRSRSQNVSSV